MAEFQPEISSLEVITGQPAPVTTNTLGVFTGQPAPITTQSTPATTGEPPESTVEPAPIPTPPVTSSLQGGQSTISLVAPSSSTNPLLSNPPFSATISLPPSHTTAIPTSSLIPIHTAATVLPSTNPIPPSSRSAGLSGVARVGIGLGIPLGILCSAAILYISIRYHRHRTLQGILPTASHAADTAQKDTTGQNRDDGVVRELY